MEALERIVSGFSLQSLTDLSLRFLFFPKIISSGV
nr:MAG TPA: Pardaxin [Bacteriophage sp.]